MSINLKCFLSACLYDTHLDGADGVAVGACRHGTETDKKRKRYQLLMQMAHVDQPSANENEQNNCIVWRSCEWKFVGIMRSMLVRISIVSHSTKERKRQISYLFISPALALALLSLSLSLSLFSESGKVANRKEMHVCEAIKPHQAQRRRASASSCWHNVRCLQTFLNLEILFLKKKKRKRKDPCHFFYSAENKPTLYAGHVDPSALAFSLSSDRHSSISLLFSFRIYVLCLGLDLSLHKKQTVLWQPVTVVIIEESQSNDWSFFFI